MRSFRGVSSNITEPIIAKVISKACSPEAQGSDSFLFVYDECREGGVPRCGFIFHDSHDPPNEGGEVQVRILERACPISVGDILLLEPSGEGTFLYERYSHSNALLLTERCSCRCLTCPQPPVSDREDLVDLSLRMIPLMDPGTQVLGITGGEPTLAWEGLLEVMEACAKHLPNTMLQLLTNGRVLKDFAKTEALANATQNPFWVCVPLYADVDDLHDQIVSARGAFWDTLEGLFNLARLGVAVELRTVVIQPNYSRLAEWAEFVYRTFPFVAHVAIMGMEPIGLAAQNLDYLWIDPVDYAPVLEKAVRILHRRNLKVSVFNHQLCTLPRGLWPFARRSISEWKNVYLSECADCVEQSACGGFFQSAGVRKSRAIAAIVS
ncbi:MAG: His-Xaa-Ser system radical SAM maturase HxsC [Syntrophobacteraceae bacterium]